MTSMPVQNAQSYVGPHNVYMSNGDSLLVTHSGNLPLSLGDSSFFLENILHIPSICKNLLSVARFTKDNFCYFLLAPDFYQIRCLCTGLILFQAPVKMGYIHSTCLPFWSNHKPLQWFTPLCGIGVLVILPILFFRL